MTCGLPWRDRVFVFLVEVRRTGFCGGRGRLREVEGMFCEGHLFLEGGGKRVGLLACTFCVSGEVLVCDGDWYGGLM